MLHIYCGDGKGKTTAALGLAVRAAGSGMKVFFFQFLKGAPTSELNSLSKIENITVRRCDKDYGFTFTMNDDDKAAITACHDEMLKQALSLAENGGADMIVLDEFNAAYECGLLDRRLAENLVLNHWERVELVLTGRNPNEKFVEAADYVSEILAVKHPYEKGADARAGIEY